MTAPHADLPSSAARTGVWVGIAAITMSFAAYTSAMVVRQGSGADWRHLDLPSILYANTLILILSSVALEAGRRRIRAGRSGEALVGATLALGLLFVAGQVIAWRSLLVQGVYLSTNPASDFFYILTGLHALHVAGGLGGLMYLIARLRDTTGRSPRSTLDAVALYWHFMGVLWLYLLVILVTRL